MIPLKRVFQLSIFFIASMVVLYLLLPLLSIFLTKNPFHLLEKAVGNEVVIQALRLSLQTTSISIVLIVLFCTPLAYQIAKKDFAGKKVLDVLLKMPIVVPAAVAGVGLLLIFGQNGLLGDVFSLFDIEIPFTPVAVVLAQIFMASPFYLNTARQSFEAIDDQFIYVSRTLGVSKMKTFWRVVLPLSSPGLLSAIALSWALALGEFGATMMFAGNLPGSTQTLPLAVFSAMESDMDLAIAISAILLTASFLLLFVISFIDKYIRKRLTS